MANRERINQVNGDEDAATPAIAYNVLRSFVTSLTQAMTNDIANATVPIPVTPNTITYFSAIDPYDNESFETKTK